MIKELLGTKIAECNEIHSQILLILMMNMTTAICDQICEKGSYTRIQFFEFKEV